MTDPRATILLVDDHALFRDSVARFLDGESGFQIVGGCATVQEAREFLQANPVDLVLLDFDLGGARRHRLHACRRRDRLSGKGPAGHRRGGRSRCRQPAQAGHRRGIPEAQPARHAGRGAIREVLAGNVWFEQNYLKKIVGHAAERAAENQVPRTRKLTEREQQVLTGVFEGLANKQIAARLNVSESSVKATLQQLFQKTGVRNRSQLVRIALEQYRELI